MNEQSSSNDPNDPLELKTPGKLLKAARERRGLQQRGVADRMRLSLQTIVDIESDDYTHFTAEIYLRGHLRNFSRIVNLDENEVLQCYESMGTVFEAENRERLLSIQTAPVTTQRTRRSKRRPALLWVSFMVLLILVVMVVLWWREQQSHMFYTLSSNSGSTEVQTIPITAANTDANVEKPIMIARKATKKTTPHKARKTTLSKTTMASSNASKKKVRLSSRSNKDYNNFVPDYQIVPVKQ